LRAALLVLLHGISCEEVASNEIESAPQTCKTDPWQGVSVLLRRDILALVGFLHMKVTGGTQLTRLYNQYASVEEDKKARAAAA